jgi:hypothetical protein
LSILQPLSRLDRFILLTNLGEKMKVLLVALTLISSVFANEELRYETVLKEGNIEVREYQPYITASISFDSEEQYDRNAFRVLADFIFGNNISMTSPVLTNENIGMTVPVFIDGDEIGMTAPVLTNTDELKWKMSFVMPSRYTMETLPKPIDKRIVIQYEPAKTLAAVKFNGLRTLERNTMYENSLRHWINSQTLEVISEAIYAGYDAPSTPPVSRRNEVLIEVK